MLERAVSPSGLTSARARHHREGARAEGEPREPVARTPLRAGTSPRASPPRAARRETGRPALPRKDQGPCPVGAARSRARMQARTTASFVEWPAHAPRPSRSSSRADTRERGRTMMICHSTEQGPSHGLLEGAAPPATRPCTSSLVYPRVPCASFKAWSARGMGHATRSKRQFSEHLVAAGHEVKIVVSGRAHAFLSKSFPDVVEIKGLTIRYVNNRMDRDGTLCAQRDRCAGDVLGERGGVLRQGRFLQARSRVIKATSTRSRTSSPSDTGCRSCRSTNWRRSSAGASSASSPSKASKSTTR